MSTTHLGHNGQTDSNSDDQLGYDDALQSGGDQAASQISPGLPLALDLPQHAAASPAPAAVTTYDDVLETSGNVTFDLKFAHDADDNPTANTWFEKGVESAAKILAQAMNINHAVEFNIVVNTPSNMLNTGGADAGPGGFVDDTYTNVVADLKNNEVKGDTNFSALPTGGDDNGFSSVEMTSAQQKAFGLIPGSAADDDGTANFDVNIADDAITGVALHEIAHALGRVPAGPPNGSNPDIFDLFRFTAPNTILVDDNLQSAPAYFSVDGGKTPLVQYGLTSDPSDLLNSSAPDDAFSEFYSPGATYQGLTQVDLTQMDVLGFDTWGSTPTAPCYVRGTRIRSERGETLVEDLRVGERVVTACGQLRPIKWLGRRRLDIARHPDPAAVRPVRVAAGAFGAGLPARDLWLSPGHSVVWRDSLIQIERLVNGRSVAQVDQPSVEYWHVELETHDILIAEGLPAESYLDTGNRAGFENGGAFVEAHPDFSAKHWRETCLPLVQSGPELVAAKACLLARLFEQGHAITREGDAHIVADGVRIEPLRLAQRRFAFVLPEGANEIALCSRVFVPAHTEANSLDERALGLAVARLQIDGEEIALDGEEMGAGWDEAELRDGRFMRRWTSGAARLAPGARLVLVDLADEGVYWRIEADNVVALPERRARRA